MKTIDILMITYNRAAYTRLALERLLATCDPAMRVWIWHNGNDEETLGVVRAVLDHPRIHRFHHSPENKKLREPTNWLFSSGKGDFVAKVDDDCLMPFGWAGVLRRAHADNDRFGAIGCWHFQEEDFLPELSGKKIREFRNRHWLMLNCWVAGSGYLMKRTCIEECGLIKPTESFTQYCVRLARRGWINGWYYPFLLQEHMDDPRSRNTMLKTDADLVRWTPLSSRTFGATTLQAWTDSLVADARYVQSASADPSHYGGWRLLARRVGNRARRLLSGSGAVHNRYSS